MRRVVVLAAALAAALLLIAPATLAADPAAGEGRVLFPVNGDVTRRRTRPPRRSSSSMALPRSQATSTRSSSSKVRQSSTVPRPERSGRSGARPSCAGTIVTGEVMTLDSAVHQAGDATVQVA